MYIHRDIHTYRQNVMGRGTSKIKRGARGTVALKKPLLHALFVISHKPGRTDYIYIFLKQKTHIYICVYFSGGFRSHTKPDNSWTDWELRDLFPELPGRVWELPDGQGIPRRSP